VTTHTSKYAGHTPNLVVVGGNTDGWLFIQQTKRDRVDVARVYGAANALLFADAPIILAQRDRLAEALRKLIEFAEYADHRIDDEWGGGKYREDESISLARTALSELEQTQ
jgi:hypothetical protein